jgi:hypothetical protein
VHPAPSFCDSKRTLNSFIIPEFILSSHMTDSLGRLEINTSEVECRHNGCVIGNRKGRAWGMGDGGWAGQENEGEVKNVENIKK